MVSRVVVAAMLLAVSEPGLVSQGFELRYAPEDAEIGTELRPVVEAGIRQVEDFFGAPYRESFTVDLLPSREAFTAWFPAEWGMGETACWMVATGVDQRMAALSPRVWRDQACDHDPDDVTHVRNLIVHELVHVYHGQLHPSTDFEVAGIERIGWFLEGLAVYASGQMDERHGTAAADAIEAGVAPVELEQGWSGAYRYGVSGSLVKYIDLTFGRDVVLDLMTASTEQEVLERLELTEAELLAAWRKFVLAGRG